MGAEKAGNADGTIPAWDGGLTEPPTGYKPGEHLVDPFKEDTVLFTITAANMDNHKDKLTPGQQALLTTYPDTYKMNVYPTRRSAAFPQRIYDKTKEIAATARLTAVRNISTGSTPRSRPTTNTTAQITRMMPARRRPAVRARSARATSIAHSPSCRQPSTRSAATTGSASW